MHGWCFIYTVCCVFVNYRLSLSIYTDTLFLERQAARNKPTVKGIMRSLSRRADDPSEVRALVSSASHLSNNSLALDMYVTRAHVAWRASN